MQECGKLSTKTDLGVGELVTQLRPRLGAEQGRTHDGLGNWRCRLCIIRQFRTFGWRAIIGGGRCGVVIIPAAGSIGFCDTHYEKKEGLAKYGSNAMAWVQSMRAIPGTDADTCPVDSHF